MPLLAGVTGSAPGCHPSNEAGISLGDGSNNPARPADSARMENRGRVEEVQGEDGQGIQLPGVGAPLGGPLPNHGGMINAGNLGLVRQVNHVWGEGVKLGEVEHNPHAIDPVPKATSAGDSAIKRLERRLRPHHHEGGTSTGSPHARSCLGRVAWVTSLPICWKSKENKYIYDSSWNARRQSRLKLTQERLETLSKGAWGFNEHDTLVFEALRDFFRA